jgi:hypothetical protein
MTTAETTAQTAAVTAAPDPPGLPFEGFRAAARWARRHPQTMIPLAVALAAFITVTVLTGMLAAGGVTAFVFWVITLIITASARSGRRARSSFPTFGQPAALPGAGLGRAAQWPDIPAGAWQVTEPAPPPPAPRVQARVLNDDPPPQQRVLHGMGDVLSTANGILSDMHPGPETVTAVDPGTVTVRWDGRRSAGQATDLPPHRRDKMQIIQGEFRRRVIQAGLLYQFPQILLIASDGAAVELLGDSGFGRTGAVEHGEPPAGGGWN